MFNRVPSRSTSTILSAPLHALAAGGLLLLAVVVLILTLIAAGGLLGTDTAGGRWDGGRWDPSVSAQA